MARKKTTKVETPAENSQEWNYRDCPPLAEYIERIGAEQLNFRRYMVKEHKGKYYTEKCIIRILPDYTIACSNPEYAPTEEEALKIQGALSSAKPFPTSIGATEAQYKQLLSRKELKGSLTYPLWDRATDTIMMVQQRVQRSEAAKDKEYHPWSMWSDGIWRRMEPEGELLFYKPRKGEHGARIMVHEGAKAAAGAARAAEKDSGHPWQDELATYEHWGILGGALAPHRAKYSELVDQKPSEVVYVCDNDHEGRSVLEIFSERWGRSLLAVKFDARFPVGFDLADDLPEKLFREGRWIGGQLRHLTHPATRATYLGEPGEDGGRPPILMCRAFLEEWRHTIQPEFYINIKWAHRVYTQDEFNNLVRPFSHSARTSEILKKHDSTKAVGIDYMPDQPQGCYTISAGQMINVYNPSPIKPIPGDAKPWLEYIEGLIPIPEDRAHVLKWCATLIARPDIHMTYSLLLVSETQGVGKSTLGEKILGPLVGEENYSTPSEESIVESSFNGWASHKRLAVVGEIYAGQSKRAYNKLKSIITDDKIEVNEKFVKSYKVKNWLHFLACSNSMRALSLDMEDRRWLVPKVTERARPASYWRKFNHWLEVDGLPIIAHWAKEYVEQHGHVHKGEIAPMSSAKEELIEENYSPGQTIIHRLLRRIQEEKQGEELIILDRDLVQVVKDQLWGGKHSDKLEKPVTARKLAKKLGWKSGSRNSGCKAWGLGFQEGIVLSNSKALSALSPSRLAEMGHKPLDLKEFLDI